MEIKLPTSRQEPERINPQMLIIYSKPKVGKTDAVAHLDNCLIIELDKNGSDFVHGMILKANDLNELKSIGEAIKEANNPYEYIAIDTITTLEDMVLPLAGEMYKDTPMGKNWNGDNILKLPSGGGYMYLRLAFRTVINSIRTWAPNIILLGHLKDKMIEKDGKEVSALELDLTGKLKSLISADADAIAYMYRGEDNQNILNFEASEQVICGARSPHLKNQKIVISKLENNGDLTTYWDKIYIK